MNPIFHMAVLRYRPSIGTGEALNVGVLVLFPLQRQLRFRVPASFVRLKAAFPRLPERVLKNYVRSFADRVAKLNDQPEVFVRYEGNPDTLVSNEIFIRDASSLFFSEVKTGVLFSDDLDRVADQVARHYLAEYALAEEARRIHDEYYLVSTFRKKISQCDEGLLGEKIKPNVKITINDLPYRFDFSWKNHALHLVKPVSLDLQTPENIIRKVHTQIGKFTVLEPEADANNWVFDVLLAKPRSQRLNDVYHSATELLRRSSKKVTVWEEEELTDYVKETVEQAEPHP